MASKRRLRHDDYGEVIDENVALRAEIERLRARLDAMDWRPLAEPPDRPCKVMLYRRYDEPNVWEWRNQAGWDWPAFSAAAINEGYTHWRPYPGPAPTEE